MKFWFPLALAGALAGCSVAPVAGPGPSAPVAVVGATPAASSQPAAPAASAKTVTLTGQAKAPASATAKRRLLASSTAPVANATVTVTAGGNALDVTATTDAEGRYTLTFAYVVDGKPLVVTVQPTDGGEPLRTMVVPNAEGSTTADVDDASSIATTYTLSRTEAFVAETFKALSAAVETRLRAETAVDFKLGDTLKVVDFLTQLAAKDPKVRDLIAKPAPTAPERPTSGGGGFGSDGAEDPEQTNDDPFQPLLNGQVK